MRTRVSIAVALVSVTLLAWSGAVIAAIAAPVPAADRSLAPSEYIARGMPAHDRDWMSDDYERAAAVLKALAADDPATLPRRASSRSGLLFARMTSTRNLELLHTPGLDVQQRLGVAVPLFQELNEVLAVYVSASREDAVLDAELVDLLNLTLRATLDLVGIADAFFESLPRDDPKRKARLDGRDQMRAGMASIVDGSLTTLTEHGMYHSSELERLARGLQEVLPRLLPSLPPGARQEIPVRLERMISDEPDAAFRVHLQAIASALRARTGQSPPA
ncbi:MAG TPA: hypothetical protein VHQ90_20950 [Thermoanaerobaculia bacterium]|nr:hypothetical protein [Thermoanaerobaculia bacterium]